MGDLERSDSALRRWAERVVNLLDDKFRIPGTDFRFGLDPIIGMVPGVGDTVTGASSIGLLTLALRSGVPRVVMLRMILNILVDVFAGSLPIVGDLFDVAYKSNRRNLELIRAHEGPASDPSFADYAIVTLGMSLAILGVVVPLVVAFYFGFNYGPEIIDRLRLR
jgi:hypothetical protein